MTVDDAPRGGSHTEMMRDISQNFGLPTTKKYIREVRSAPYEKGLCPYCERELSNTVCERFASMVSKQVSEYMEPCCPECGEWIDGFERVEQVEMLVVESFAKTEDVAEYKRESKANTRIRVKPCGCLRDEEQFFFQARVPENDDTAEERLANLERNEGA